MKRHTAIRVLVSLALGLLLLGGLTGCQSRPGIDTPVNVSGVDLKLYSATYNPNVSFGSGKALMVKAEILSGADDPSKWDVSLTDSSGDKSTPGLTATGTSPSGKPDVTWGFDVAAGASSLTLHLPGGQTILVDSLVK
jgi:hypothetical protein